MENPYSIQNINIPSGDDREDVSPFFTYIESLERNNQKNDGSVKPHFHSQLFQVTILESGEVTFHTENKDQRINYPCVILIPEGKIHSITYHKPTKGYMMLMSLLSVDECLRQLPEGFKVVDDISIVSEEIAPYDFEDILDLGISLNRKMIQKDRGSLVIKKNYSVLILLVILNSLRNAQKPNFKEKYAESSYLYKYKKMIREKVDASGKVADYAKAIGITPTHLNRVCKQLVNKSALEIMHDNIILEAKKHIMYSTFSVSEIANILNFKDPSHFSKFFKKSTGQSPKFFKEDIE
ncbi:helix-turn-helix transcriptional regulator [Bacteroidia bacterium]|nr:helix-turn-helix transcriptional regulator [Bacteroidia bacterium]MDC1395283.1 helix-turn-helix transcriptional regulator [Bacteroidia bacterium]